MSVGTCGFSEGRRVSVYELSPRMISVKHYFDDSPNKPLIIYFVGVNFALKYAIVFGKCCCKY